MTGLWGRQRTPETGMDRGTVAAQRVPSPGLGPAEGLGVQHLHEAWLSWGGEGGEVQGKLQGRWLMHWLESEPRERW